VRAAAGRTAEDVLVRYFDAIDRFDWDAVGACFAADARASYGGGPLLEGRDAIVERLREAHTAEASTHLLGGVVAEAAGAGFRTRSAVVAYLKKDGAVRIRGLRYEDLIEERDGGWRIVERRHTMQWMAEAPARG